MTNSLWIYFNGDYSSNRDKIENFVQKYFPKVETEGSGCGFGSNDISFKDLDKKLALSIINKIRKSKRLMKIITSFDIFDHNRKEFIYEK